MKGRLSLGETTGGISLVKISVDAKALNKKMAKLTKGFKYDLTAQINKSAEIIQRDIRLKTKGQMDIDGSRLEKLKKSTKIAKKKAGYTHPNAPLQATGEMTGQFGKKGVRIKEATKRNQVAIIDGTHVPYGIYHQLGDESKNLPVRKWFGISKDAEQRIIITMARKINSLLK